MTETGPKVEEIRALAAKIAGHVTHTPVLRCHGIEALMPAGTEVYGKLEFLQHTGTFKARGALATLMALSDRQRQRGVIAVSAGNHAIATAYAAQVASTSAKVVMIQAANPARTQACRAYGAEIVLAADVHEAFAVAEQIGQDEGRYLAHPFEGPAIALGTGTLGLEICEQIPDLDALVVPVGGGGLIGGVSNAVRQVRPKAEIIGVEPEGADSMHRSFASGRPERLDKVATIADSLGAPYAMPYSYSLARANVDDVIRISDDALRRTMGLLFERMKIAVEPACAASTAALLGPLRHRLAEKRVVLLFCGSNIDWSSWYAFVNFDDQFRLSA